MMVKFPPNPPANQRPGRCGVTEDGVEEEEVLQEAAEVLEVVPGFLEVSGVPEEVKQMQVVLLHTGDPEGDSRAPWEGSSGP